jgi:O-antigen/teichoic acid export membrane protein
MISKLKPKSEFSRNVLTLMTGTTIAQAIPIAISPILTRLYSPEDFGLFALYMSIAGMFSIIATGRYELAIMLPKSNEDTLHIVILSAIIILFISCLSLLIIILFQNEILKLLNNDEISQWLYVIPLSVILVGFYQIINFWANRQKSYKVLANSKVIKSASSSASNISLGMLGGFSGGLIVGELVGQFFAIISLLKQNKLYSYIVSMENIKTLKIIALAKKYKKLPLLNAPNALIDGFRMSGINILISQYFSNFILGHFSLAWRMLQAPMVLVGSSLSQVLLQKLSSSDRGKLYQIALQFIFKSALIALPIFIFIYLYAYDIFMFVFGNQWKISGEIASLLSPWLFMNFISSPISSIFIILNRQEIMLIFSIFYMLVPLSLIYFFNSSSILIVINYISVSMAFMLLIFIAMALYIAGKVRT